CLSDWSSDVCSSDLVERVQSLYARHLLKATVLDALRTDGTLSPRLRAAALEVAERRSENALGLYEAAWLTIVRPIGRPDENRLRSEERRVGKGGRTR